MASMEKPLSYEVERQRIIEENKRRMQELGLMGTLAALRETKNGYSTPRKYQRRRPNLVDFGWEARRSSRSANRPKVDYKEASMDVGLRRTRVARTLRRGEVSAAAKNEAAVRAGDIKTSHPSFVKAMLKSHTSGGFWLGLPCDFCTTHFTKDDIVILEDEEGLEWECVYLHHKHGLSGGWRGFSLDHDLEDGDAVVFELVTSTRFKVHITRAIVSGEPSRQNTSAVAKKKVLQYVVRDSTNLHVHSVLHKALKREKGELAEKELRDCKPAKRVKPMKRNISKSRYDSSDDSEESEEILEDESQSNEEEVAIEDSEDSDGVSEQDSDEDSKPAVREAKKSVKSTQHLKMKTESKSQQGISRRRESTRTSIKVIKKENFARRADRKIVIQEVRKVTEQKCKLPPGSRLKPVGVCSIAKGSTKRKLPAMFPARKYSFFSGSKSVKVH